MPPTSSSHRPKMRLRAPATVMAVMLAAALTGCGEQPSDKSTGTTVSLASSTLFEGPVNELTRNFTGTAAGKGVRFNTYFEPSAALAQNLSSHAQKADVAILASSQDVETLKSANLASSMWSAGPDNGIVAQTLVALMVRKNNPRRIRTWDDLARPGVSIVAADPVVASRWDLAAPYVYATKAKKWPKPRVESYLRKVYNNVDSWNPSNASATAQFLSGRGDVLLTYESTAISQRAAGFAVDYVIPEGTLWVEHPGVALRGSGPAASRFLSFAHEDEQQKVLASQGYRPLRRTITVAGVKGTNNPDNPYPAPRRPLTIDEAGGWRSVNTILFNPNTGLFMKLRN